MWFTVVNKITSFLNLKYYRNFRRFHETNKSVYVTLLLYDNELTLFFQKWYYKFFLGDCSEVSFYSKFFFVKKNWFLSLLTFFNKSFLVCFYNLSDTCSKKKYCMTTIDLKRTNKKTFFFIKSVFLKTNDMGWIVHVTWFKVVNITVK